MTSVEWLFIIAVAAAAAGYAFGRRVGQLEGRAEGLASAPLALRARALEVGRCPICGHAAQERPVATEGGSVGPMAAGASPESPGSAE